MKSLFIIALTILPLICQGCYSSCTDCTDLSSTSPYKCTACYPHNDIYFYSCQPESQANGAFIALCVVVTVLYGFMLIMGFGMYRDLMEGLQMVSLCSWRFGSQAGTEVLQVTNLAVVINNSFPKSFGAQFIVIMILLSFFWLMLILVNKITHNPTVILLTRKRIIFPTRIFTFFFNILLFASVMQVTTIPTQSSFDAFAFSLAILALIKVGVVFIGLVVSCNWKNFSPDDPHYYVLVEQLTSKRWYAKNNLVFSLLTRAAVILSFTIGFKSPQIAGIIMFSAQTIYTFYVALLLRYTKIRYHILNVIGNGLVAILLAMSYQCGVQQINSNKWISYRTAYLALILILTIMLFLSMTTEIMIRRDPIVKMLKSMYLRFIVCEKLDEGVQLNKFDKNSQRERVTEFKANLIYHKSLSNPGDVELRDNSF